MAQALGAAHSAGIVHRDLKPGNVMLTTSGAKLLDFGLAKASAGEARGAAGARSTDLTAPNLTSPLTLQGTILGTLQYMSPEQLEGKEADPRTDIFAFGIVLYEMLTGRKAFEAKSQVGLIAAILEHEPHPIRAIAPQVSDALEHIVLRCLAKDPADRWQSVRDVTHELRWATLGQPAPDPFISTVSPARSLTQRVAWPLAVASLLATVVIGSVHWFEADPIQPTVRFEVTPPSGTTFLGGTQLRMALSADGTKLAFVAASEDGKSNQLWIRRLDSLEATVLPGTDRASAPFWSPDGRFVGFFADDKLKVSEITSGRPQTLCDAPGLGPSGTWNRDDQILFNAPGGIRRVSASGGESTPVTTVDVSQGERAHLKPRFLPGGRRFLFLTTTAVPEDSHISVGSLDSTSVTPILRSEYQAEFTLPGYLLFVREAVLFAQPVDPDSLAPRGEPVRIVDNVSWHAPSSTAAFSVSGGGVLGFRQGFGGSGGSDLEFRWFDRTGKELSRTGGAWPYRGIDLSADGNRVASHRHEEPGGDIWLTEVDTGNNQRFTFDPAQHNTSPIWSPDGTQIAFASFRNGSWGIYRKASNGVGAEERLFESRSLTLPLDWSRDGQTIVFLQDSDKTRGDLWRLPLGGERKPLPILQGPAVEHFGQLSPDGRWLTYMSSESGRGEIYVRSTASPDTRYQLSAARANFPRWRRDGKEILFMEADSGRIMSVMVQPAGDGLRFTAPTPLFDSQYVNFGHGQTGGGPYHQYAVSPDGQRFVIPLRGGDNVDESNPVVVLNWISALQR